MAYQTVLYRHHIQLGAKMVEFGGWDMPLQYEGILEEHKVNRQACSVFDCSHMGEFFIKGDPVKSGLDRIVTQSITDMSIRSCRYGSMVNEKGGVLDDLILYRMAEDYWGVVVNAANIAKNRMHFETYLSKDAEFEDASARIAKIDVQGPLSREVLAPFASCVNELAYYTFDTTQLLGEEAIVSRTGYTGELGFEIYYPADKVGALWDALLEDERVKPTGLGVRDVLRIEMCYPLYGHELSEDITPLDAGLKKFIDFDKEFIGQKALIEYDQKCVAKKCVCLRSLTRRAPREGFAVLDQQKNNIGVVTSGTFSPVLGLGIALARVERDAVKVGDTVLCQEGKKNIEAEVVKRPFYRDGSLKN